MVRVVPGLIGRREWEPPPSLAVVALLALLAFAVYAIVGALQ